MLLGTKTFEVAAPGLKLEKLAALNDEVVAASVTVAFMLLNVNGFEAGATGC